MEGRGEAAFNDGVGPGIGGERQGGTKGGAQELAAMVAEKVAPLTTLEVVGGGRLGLTVAATTSLRAGCTAVLSCPTGPKC